MKDTILIAPLTATYYKGIFELMVDLTLKIGYANYRKSLKLPFVLPDGTGVEKAATWYTTLNVNHDNKFIPTAVYDDTYERYDNYDAIEVKKYTRIPYDYDGKMGVPTTFFFYYPDLYYEILELRSDLKLNGKELFKRLIIRKKNYEK